MANISAFSINNCFANVADNNVHENIVSAESLTEEVVAKMREGLSRLHQKVLMVQPTDNEIT